MSCTQEAKVSKKVTFSVVIDSPPALECVVPEGTTYRDLDGLSLNNSNDNVHNFKVDGDCLMLNWQECGLNAVYIDEALSNPIDISKLDNQVPDGVTLYVSTMPPV